MHHYHNHKRPWTIDDNTVISIWAERWRGDNQRVAKLARKLGRTENAIRTRLREMDARARLPGYRTLCEIAVLLGVNSTTPLNWLTGGYFVPGVKPHKAMGGVYQVPDDDLWDWMTDPRSWELWHPDDITDSDWRRYFVQLRRPWLRTGDAARLLGFSVDGLRNMAKGGRITAYKFGGPRNTFFFRRDELEHFKKTRGASRERRFRQP